MDPYEPDVSACTCTDQHTVPAASVLLYSILRPVVSIRCDLILGQVIVPKLFFETNSLGAQRGWCASSVYGALADPPFEMRVTSLFVVSVASLAFFLLHHASEDQPMDPQR